MKTEELTCSNLDGSKTDHKSTIANWSGCTLSLAQ